MSKMITNSQAPLRDSVGKGKKLLNIPKGSVVNLLEIVPDVEYFKLNTLWLEVEYRGFQGFSYAGFFDKYENRLLQNVVDLSGLQTPDEYDAKQYVLIDGKKKYNMCGEISCAYIMGMGLKEILNGWSREKPNTVSRIFKGSVDRGTSAQTLVGLLDSFGVKSKTISSCFRDPLLKRTIFTLQRAFESLKDNHIILGVKIGRDGLIGHGNIGHWIVLTEIEMYGEQGVCTVFNPYDNCYEIYSWEDLVSANAGIDGVVVPLQDKESDNWLESIKVEPLDVLPHPKPIKPVAEFGAALSLEEKVDLLWKEFEFIQSVRNSN